jgi:hypothetical protein
MTSCWTVRRSNLDWTTDEPSLANSVTQWHAKRHQLILRLVILLSEEDGEE